MPTYYLEKKCNFCEFKPYAKCEANGYDDESMKLYFKEKQKLQKKENKTDGTKTNSTKDKNKKKKKNKKKDS